MHSAKHCFVGHAFTQEQIDDLRPAIQKAFGLVAPLLLCYADEYIADSHISSKVESAIDNSLMCIFEVSEINPNVFLELGYARRAAKRCLLLVKKGRNPPSDIAGLDRIEYESYSDLTNKLVKFLPRAIGKKGEIDKRVLLALEERLRDTVFSKDDIRTRAQVIGREAIPLDRVDGSLATLGGSGDVEAVSGGWRVTEKGRRSIPELCQKLGLREQYS